MIHRHLGHLARLAALIGIVLLPSLFGCATQRRSDQHREQIRSFYHGLLIDDVDRPKGWDLLSALGDGDVGNYGAKLGTIRKDLHGEFEADFKRWKALEPIRLQQTESLLKSNLDHGERFFLQMMD